MKLGEFFRQMPDARGDRAAAAVVFALAAGYVGFRAAGMVHGRPVLAGLAGASAAAGYLITVLAVIRTPAVQRWVLRRKS